jgi:nitric oxide reductase subunit B
MQVSRRTVARLLAFAFVANLVVMGAGAWYSYEHAPRIPGSSSGPTARRW